MLVQIASSVLLAPTPLQLTLRRVSNVMAATGVLQVRFLHHVMVNVLQVISVSQARLARHRPFAP
jgi:hypothetical protein